MEIPPKDRKMRDETKTYCIAEIFELLAIVRIRPFLQRAITIDQRSKTRRQGQHDWEENYQNECPNDCDIGVVVGMGA